MAPKYSNSMLKDPSIRAKIQKELSELELEMKIMNFNQEKHFCFLSHEDFSDHIFCSGKCIEKGYMEAKAKCLVKVGIREFKEKPVFTAIRCTILNSSDSMKNSPQKRNYDSRKTAYSQSKSNAQKKEDFYKTREEFFKASRMGRDESVFAIYLNRAVTNFCLQTNGKIVPQENFDPKVFRKKINDLDPDTLRKLAHFLFLFAVIEPAGYLTDDEKNGKTKKWQNICADYGEALISLRNFFSHTDRELKNELHLKDSFYHFLGKLNGEISLSVKHDAHALAQFPLFRRITKEENSRFVTYQELTKHGIAFICCMALFKDAANHFCSQLSGLGKRDMFSDSMREFFTKTSFPPHRQFLEQKTPEILMFADIINYLNKAPAVCLQNLSLQEERARMDNLKSLSGKIDDNKIPKFQIRERSGDKFASYALSYLDDFAVLPHFTFRHLDTSASETRQRYSYEKISPDTLPTNRHFYVDHDSVQFEWKFPEGQNHHGKIRIKALHGMMTDRMLQEIMYLALNPAQLNIPVSSIDQQMHQWFSAYHAFLEKVLDRAHSQSSLSIEDFLPELQILSGKTEDEIRSNSGDILKNIIGPGLAAFFENQERPDDADRIRDLTARVTAALEHDLELEKRFRNEKLSDALMIRQVFRFFNLQLENTPWQFRQLPLSQQHRGCLDYEYQTVHALIGKYTSAPNDLWKHFRKMGGKKGNDSFRSAARLSKEDACSYCKSRNDLLENSKSLKRTSSLEDLSFAALRECIREEKNVLKRLDPEAADKPSAGEIRCWAVRYGVKQNKRYNTEDLIRTVLKINLADWRNAFNYETMSGTEKRSLENSDFIIPQITIPQDLFCRMLSRQDILAKIQKNPRSVWNPDTEKIDFMHGIRNISHEVALRHYYDVSTLVQWLIDNSSRKNDMPVCAERKNDVSRAYRSIRKVQAHDSLLLLAAMEYWKKYCRYDSRLKFTNEEQKNADIYDFLTRDIIYMASGKKIRIHLNDLNKMAFPLLTANSGILQSIFENLSLSSEEIPDFDSLQREMNRIKDSDIRIQKKFIIPVLKFYDNAGDIPVQKKPDGMTNKEWEEKLPFKIAEALHAKGYGTCFSLEEIVLLMDFRNALLHDKFNLEKIYSVERIDSILLKMTDSSAH